MKENGYPYIMKDGYCNHDPNVAVAQAQTWDWLHPTPGYIDTFTAQSYKDALASHGLVGLMMYASETTFGYWGPKSGIYNPSNCSTAFDHAVVGVGWGILNGQEYMIVRNSWGTSWGESGYFRTPLHTDGPGVCGIQQYAYFITDSNKV